MTDTAPPKIELTQVLVHLMRGVLYRDSHGQLWQALGALESIPESRWSLEDRDVESHLGLSYDFMVHLLTQPEAEPRKFDPSGEEPLHGAKTIRRRVLDGGTRNRAARLIEAAEEHFGLPTKELAFWPDRARPLPWRAAAQKRPRRLEA